MSIPYNDNLKWGIYTSNPDWYKGSSEQAPELLNAQVFHQPPSRAIQFIRDLARLVLKVPIRAIMTPIVLPKNWKERERSKINAKLTGYSFVQLLLVPVKFLVAIAAISASAISCKRAEQWLLDKSEGWTTYTTHLDGRASQLEALKEEGIKKSNTREEYAQYREWLYNIDSKLCRKLSPEVTKPNSIQKAKIK